MRTLAALVLIAGTSLTVASGGEGAPAGAKTVMDTGTMLRFHITLRKVPNVKPAYRKKEDRREAKGIDHDPQNAPAPADWASADFDDSHWPRTRPEWLGRSTYLETSILSLRGAFNVTDPAAVKGLYLTLGYRGGAVVYLNGKEVGRLHLPKGKLALETEAEAYPDDVWLGKDGKPLANPRRMKDKGEVARIARQVRSGNLTLPTSALRKGVNVLAVELRRAPYHNATQQWFKRAKGRGKHDYTIWKPIGLVDLKLQATGGGIQPNLPRPAGIQVWTPDVNDRLSALDYGDYTAKPRIRIVGVRNGSFCGQIALGSAKAFSGVKAVASDLTGPGTIPAARVKILYGAFNRESGGVPYTDGLLAKPPAQVPVRSRTVRTGKRKDEVKKVPCGAAQLVFVRVEVPKDAKAGDYRGEITVSADGLAATKVPLELHLSDWTLPDSQEFRTFISLYQSPTSVALQYKVEMWSEEHWKLLEKSWELLARAGNKIANVHAIEQTQF
ncbi:MAG: glycoside hydrolase domain-containing protein, partial [Planctomycetota bacterium]